MPSVIDREERDLIDACINGEAAAWDELLRRYGGLIRFAVNAVRRRYSAWSCELEDMAGHVLEKLLDDGYRRLRAWRGEAKFGTYLLHAANNLCIDYVAKHNRIYLVASSDDMPDRPKEEELPEKRELRSIRRKALLQAIKQLPPKQAMIVRMRLKGHTLKGISRLMGIPVGTVAANNSRALKQLRKVIAPMAAGEDLLQLSQEEDEE